MDAFQKKTFKTSRGYTYTYYVADGDKSLPALFFQHGWPDHAGMWKDVATSLRSLKHPIIIPDMLGYGGTDKPTDPAEYKWDVMTKDLIELIDTEGHPKIISIGHDWGSGCASRMYNHYPDRVAGLVNVNVAYTPPLSQPFDLEKVNATTEKIFGYPIFSYWEVNAAPDGPQVLKDGVEHLFDAMHGDGPLMKEIFTVPGRFREHLRNGSGDIARRSYASDPAFKQEFVDRMRRDGFEGPQCWYVAQADNHHYETDKTIPQEHKVVNVPSLFIGCKKDPVCRPEAVYPHIQAGLLPQLEQAELIDSAHWSPYEKPQDVAARMESWLKKNFTQKQEGARI
jgi:soluble epoxide hydrolase/lipid-phosphate phosphatase